LLRLLEEPEVGKTYDGVVRRIVDFGAFVEYLPGREGLVHISKMAPYRVESVTDILQMNQEVPVRIIEIDKMGRVNLSLIYDQGSSDRHSGDRHASREGGSSQGGGRPERSRDSGQRGRSGSRGERYSRSDRDHRSDARPRHGESADGPDR
jgi:polyribonucleotide nucleotidyltransferase